MSIDMETIRIECADRIVVKLETLADLREAERQINGEHRNENDISHDKATELLRNHGRRDFSEDLKALTQMSNLVRKTLGDDIWMDCEQYASLLVRDVIKPDAQSGTMEPVVFLCGNSMGPTFRAIDKLDDIWRADDEGEYLMELWELVERKCSEANIYIDSVPDDGSIYVVDMDRWERSEAFDKEEDVEDLNDEWSSKEGGDIPSVGYRLNVEKLTEAVQVGGQTFKLKQIVKFRQPNSDTGLHMIVDIGRDSDNDVWIKLEDGQAFFDWSDILLPVEVNS